MKKTLGLIYGGKSSENEISISTAVEFSENINYDKYHMVPIYIDKKGYWHIGEIIKEERNLFHIGLLEKFNKIYPIKPLCTYNIDIAVPLLHGLNGEDGTIQGMLEMLNIPYIGNNVFASSLCIDKIKTKKFFRGTEIMYTPFIDVKKKYWIENKNEIVKELEKNIRYPMFIKPSKLGSSIGISKCFNKEELIKGIDLAFKYDEIILIEEYVYMREINIGILGTLDNYIISKPVEIITNNEFYDYESKYKDKGNTSKNLVHLDENVLEKLKENSKFIFEEIGGNGLLRIDYFLVNNKDIILNEINTLPSMRSDSVYPFMIENEGISYDEMIEILIDSAINL